MSIKKIYPHLLALLLISVLVIAYFYPSLEGNTITSGDSISSIAWNNEVKELKDKTGKDTHWNNSMFSGMPWNMISLGREHNLISYPILFFDKVVSHYPIFTFLKVGIICYLAFVLLGIRSSISFLGAITFTFAVNFLVIVGAGHQSKVETLAFLPLILSGILLAFRSKYIYSFFAISLGLSGAVLAHHVQMLFYFMFAAFFIGLFLIIEQLINKEFNKSLKIVGVIIAAFIVGLGSNFSQLYSTKSYSDDTMRGKPILEVENVAVNEDQGLSWDYAMSYSTKSIDFLTFFVPRFVGGSIAEEVAPDSEIGVLLKQNRAKAKKDGNYSAPMYWGSLPGSYTYYVGAISFLLIALFFFTENKYLRVGFVGAFLILLLFALGSYAEWFNGFMFNNVPLFNKFRAPSSALTVLPLFAVFASVLGVNQILNNQNNVKLTNKYIYISLGITIGFCAIMYVLGPVLFAFSSEIDNNYQEVVKAIFIKSRKELFKADLIRSMFFIAATGLVLWAVINQKIKSQLLAVALISLLVLVDLWGVGKRYLDEDSFTKISTFNNNYTLSNAQKKIVSLEPKGRGYYRVFNQATNTYNEAITSFTFSSIGGYSPIKLRRYQDLIEQHLSKGNMNVFNMLNSKYFIENTENYKVNNNALGNAWFVSNIINVKTPNEEIDALNNFNPKNDAVILGEEFEKELNSGKIGDGVGSIELVNYEPGYMVYKSKSASNQLAVFSEIWYGKNKGWEITINGVEANMLRANYVLRALFVPAGENEIIFSYEPKAKGGIISIICSLTIILSFLFIVYLLVKTKDEDASTTKN